VWVLGRPTCAAQYRPRIPALKIILRAYTSLICTCSKHDIHFTDDAIPIKQLVENVSDNYPCRPINFVVK